VLALLLAVSATGLGHASTDAQVTRPRVLVGRFVLSPDGADPTQVRVALSLERRGAPARIIDVATVTGPCVEDVGGLDSFAVVRCESPAGGVRVFELMQVGARIAIDERRGRAGGELARVPRRFVGRVPRRFTFVARCEETVDDPLACPPAR
jgi:hypothetical protein